MFLVVALAVWRAHCPGCESCAVASTSVTHAGLHKIGKSMCSSSVDSTGKADANSLAPKSADLGSRSFAPLHARKDMNRSERRRVVICVCICDHRGKPVVAVLGQPGGFYNFR